MADYADPLVYVAIAGGLTTIGGFVLSVSTHIGAQRHERRFKLLLDTLPDGGEPSPADSVADQIRWLEAMAEFDDLTTPRRQRVRGMLAMLGAGLLGVLSVTAAVMGFIPSEVDYKPDLGDRVLFLGAGVYGLGLALALALYGSTLTAPLFRLGGRRLKPGSGHIERIRDLRARLDLATAEDRLAYIHSRRIARRSFRLGRWFRRARHPRLYTRNVKRAFRFTSIRVQEVRKRGRKLANGQPSPVRRQVIS